jgi:hypothetical protein
MAKKSTPTFLPRTGRDHLALMLLQGLDPGRDQDVMPKYLEAARRILASPTLDPDAINSTSITSCVLSDETFKHWSSEIGRLLHEIVDPEDDFETVSAERQNVRALVYALITETMLYSAALTFELLEGGRR